jgi:uncharacterized Zn-binding protein involved in type VI secretion
VSRPFILIGDTTDHGGVVLEGTQVSDIGGKPIARVGDKVSCPKHGHGQNGIVVIVSGDPTLIIDGQPLARHGDKTSCGATLLSTQVTTTVDGGGGGQGAKQSSARAPSTAPFSANGGPGDGADATATSAGAGAGIATDVGAGMDADQHFLVLDDATKTPLKNRLYRIHANGNATEGRTNDEGKTQLVPGALGDAIKIEVFAEHAGA